MLYVIQNPKGVKNPVSILYDVLKNSYLLF